MIGPMPKAQDQIRALVETFAVELGALVHRAALERVRGVLDGEAAPLPALVLPVKAPPAPRRAPAPALRPVKTLAAPRPRLRAAFKKRPARLLAQLAGRVLDYIKANPDCKTEQMKTALGVSSDSLRLPLRRLRSENKITSKGERQSTSYSAA
jgi:hypothetical protein